MSNSNLNQNYDDYIQYYDSIINSMKKNITTQDKLDYITGKSNINPIYNKLSKEQEDKLLDYYSTDNLNNQKNQEIIDFMHFDLPDYFYGKDVEYVDNYLNMEITSDMIPIDVGLINTINSCYINCIMQIFLHNKLLYKKLLEWLYTNQNISPISRNIYDILVFLKQNFTNDRGYHKNYQCDSEEFLTWLIDKINADNLFKIKFEQKILCNNCNYVKKNYYKELFMNIKIDDETANLYKNEVINIVRLLIKQEYQDQLIDYKCKKCNHDKAIKIDKPISATKNLIFNINAPKTKIKFYDFLDIFPDEDYEYELYGIIIHIGETNSFGHYKFYYFCDIDDDNEYCLSFDDTKVKLIKKEKILNGNLDKDETIRLAWYKKIDKRELSDDSSSNETVAIEA